MDRYDTCASDNKCYMYKDIDHAPSKHFGSIRCKIHNYEIKYYLYPMSLEKTVHTGDNILIKIMQHQLKSMSNHWPENRIHWSQSAVHCECRIRSFLVHEHAPSFHGHDAVKEEKTSRNKRI